MVNNIQTLFSDLFDGFPWIDATLEGELKDFTAEESAKKITPQQNSVWEILNHIIDWREIVYKRVLGMNTPSPQNNCFYCIEDSSDGGWKIQ